MVLLENFGVRMLRPCRLGSIIFLRTTSDKPWVQQLLFWQFRGAETLFLSVKLLGSSVISVAQSRCDRYSDVPIHYATRRWQALTGTPIAWRRLLLQSRLSHALFSPRRKVPMVLLEGPTGFMVKKSLRMTRLK